MLRILLTALALAPLSVPASAQLLTRLSTYTSPERGGAEIASFDPDTRRLFFVNAAANRVDALDLTDPAAPALVLQLDLSPYGDGVNHVAVRNGLVAVAVQAEPATDPGSVVFFSTAGAFIGQVTVGALPDALAFTPDGQTLLVANEGEPNDDYSVDPEGSISIIDLTGGVPGAVTTLSFAAFNAGGPRAAELSGQPSIRITGPGATVAQDLEPEYIAVSPDGTAAYVTLQENNAVAIVDLRAGAIAAIVGLGFKRHALPENAFDPSDRDGGVRLAPWPVLGMYMPDQVATLAVGGETYFVTANEGDPRAYGRHVDHARVGELRLDAAVFPDARALQADSALGRLVVATAPADTNACGAYRSLRAFGGRSFSVHAADGRRLWDSGEALERLTAARHPEAFNASKDRNGTFDAQSPSRGPEPEGIATGTLDGTAYVFVGLEATGGVVAYAVEDPAAPRFVEYVNARGVAGDAGPAGDLGPEGLVFIAEEDSPTGRPLLVVTNESSGTVTVYRVGPE